MFRTYRTPKGTDLPLLNLRGREYLEVKYRLVWFREDHPDWAIETELLSVHENNAYARATIKDEKGRVIATSHKFESRKGFPDFIEKAETGAIGRALALIGYGTQFCADELDEGERIVDAPVEPPGNATSPGEVRFGTHAEARTDALLEARAEDERIRSSASAREGGRTSGGASDLDSPSDASSQDAIRDPGDYRISFGRKYKGLKLRDIPRNELEGYIEWLDDNARKKGLPLSEEARFLKTAVRRFLRGPQEGTSTEAGQSGKQDESVPPEIRSH